MHQDQHRNEQTREVVTYSEFRERRERRLRIVADLARTPSDAVVVQDEDGPPVTPPQAYRIQRARRWWLES
jgi:hypothetical protein